MRVPGWKPSPTHRITHSGMVPVQFQRILEFADFARYDLSSLVSLMCCGSPLRPALKRDILARIPGDFIELYGLTEGLVTIQDPDGRAHTPGVRRQALSGAGYTYHRRRRPRAAAR